MRVIIIAVLISFTGLNFSCTKEKQPGSEGESTKLQGENYINDSIKRTNLITEKSDTIKVAGKFTSEKDLLEHLKKLTYWKYYYSENGVDTTINPDDSLERENTLFQTKLLDYTSNHPETISKNFEEFNKGGLTVTTSDDGMFRIYSWDTQNGGTMHFYDNIYQFKAGDKVNSIPIARIDREGGDPRSWYSQIYTFMNNGKKYYLGIENSTYSTKDLSQSIKFFTIENNSLNDTVILANDGKEKSNVLSIEFNFFSVVDHPERPLKLILFDDKKKTISIPVVNDESDVTDKYKVYKFTGEYFEPVK